jgi:hypothetical protein
VARLLIGRLLSAIAQYPHTSMRVNSSLVQLIVSDGVAVGAVVERVTIRARRGVLLAAVLDLSQRERVRVRDAR